MSESVTVTIQQQKKEKEKERLAKRVLRPEILYGLETVAVTKRLEVACSVTPLLMQLFGHVVAILMC